jgi:hypothetical protein
MRTLVLFLILALAQTVNAQTCNTAIVADAPNSRYQITTSTVLDKQTGLVWMRCAVGQTWNGTGCTGLPTYMSWQTALQTAESTAFAGKSDWRLPNQKELQSLVESRCYAPAINTAIFAGATTDGFWSSSPYAYYSSNAWFVNFNYGDGYGSSENNNYAVRLVRAGQ